MSYPTNRGAVAFYGSSKALKIPFQLALSLLNEPTKPVRVTIPVLQTNIAPTLVYGALVNIEQLNDASEVQPDQIYYIIDHSLRGSFLRATQDRNEDYLRLTNDNSDKQQWPAQYMRVTSIRAIFRLVK
jgi:hypothetical protein